MGINVLSVGIACVPERQSFASALKDELDEQFPPGHVTMFVDKNHRGSWFGHKGASQAVHPSATHHLVLEDDVKLCDNFYDTLLGCVAAVPDEVISLYATRTNYAKSAWAIRRNYSWYCDAYGATGQAVLMPVHLWNEFLEWEKCCPPAMPYEDSRLWGWMYETGRYTWVCVRHLVEHAMPMNSTMGFNSVGKVSGDFIASSQAPDWHLGVQELKADPRPKKYMWGEEDYMKWVGLHRQSQLTK